MRDVRIIRLNLTYEYVDGKRNHITVPAQPPKGGYSYCVTSVSRGYHCIEFHLHRWSWLYVKHSVVLRNIALAVFFLF